MDDKEKGGEPSETLLPQENGNLQIQNKDDSMPKLQQKKRNFFENIKTFPKSVYFCLGCEFSERFSFYGIRAIMIIYLVSWKHLPSYEAKMLYHAFVCLAYFTPLFGSLLADGLLGKFKTILYLSVLYCIGHLLVTTGAFPMDSKTVSSILDFSGFFIIAIAAGGMRPCVAAFAADQFPPSMEEQRRQFFSFYYLSINLGALMTMLIIPALRAHVHCFNQTSCFPLAFGVPTICITLSAILFLLGKRYYKIIPREKNICGEVCGCVCYALKTKFSSSGGSKNKSTITHWLDYARPKYSDHLIKDIRALLSVAYLYLPLIPFWALYDQLGSTWVLQADAMNGQLGRMSILPDQFPLVNAILILIMVPVFESLIYPCCDKLNILKSPLKRMACGGLIAASAFVVAGFLQIAINRRALILPEQGFGRLTLINSYQSDISVYRGTQNDILSPFNQLIFDYTDKVYINSTDDYQHIGISEGVGNFAIFTPTASIINFTYPLVNIKDGQTRLYMLFDPALEDFSTGVTVCDEKCDNAFFFNKTNNLLDYIDLEPGFLGKRETYLKINKNFRTVENIILPLHSGAVYVLVILSNETSVLHQLISGNTVHMFWQLPQYVMMTSAEILISITGLEFSYSQSPESMKAVLQAVWILNGSFGNMLAMAISGSNIVKNPATEFFVYAILMFAVILLFVMMARKYKYVEKGGKAAENFG